MTYELLVALYIFSYGQKTKFIEDATNDYINNIYFLPTVHSFLIPINVIYTVH